MSMKKRLRLRGMLMVLSFLVLLLVIFIPVFPGQVNGLVYMDNLFNQISKGSSYFIPSVSEESAKFAGKSIDVTIVLSNENQALETAKLFEAGGFDVLITGKELAIKGDMTFLLKNCLEDADRMFQGDGQALADKYGYGERQVMFNWWSACKGIIKELNRQKNYREAKIFDTIQTKALEPSYNYYGVVPGNYRDNFVLVIAALAFYVIYTLWYGFGIMYLFEGIGFQIGH